MIYQDRSPAGFIISGHAMTAEAGKDILCAAISSAAYMMANTITDILGLKAEIEVAEGHMSLRIEAGASREAETLLRGLALHMEGLRREYPEKIQILSDGERHFQA